MTIESMTCKENGTKCEPLPFFWYETTVAEKSLSEITIQNEGETYMAYAIQGHPSLSSITFGDGASAATRLAAF